jgi:hypothetical protein
MQFLGTETIYFGSGSGSVFVKVSVPFPDPDPDHRYLAQIKKLFPVRSSIVSQKVVISFSDLILFDFSHSILCRIQIQMRIRKRIRNALGSGSASAKTKI